MSAAPVAGCTSSAGEGSTASAGPFSPWTQCDCPTLGPETLWCPRIWMTPLLSQCCSLERGGGGFLKSTIISTDLSMLSSRVVKTAPDNQLLNLLSVSRLVTVLDEADQCGVVCKLLELDGGVFRCAVLHVEREEQWGENTALRSSNADRTGAGCVFSQPH